MSSSRPGNVARLAYGKFTTQNWSHACTLLLRARLVPDRAGADTQAIVHFPVSQLRQLPGAADLEGAWLRARVGEDGYLTGQGAEAAACDAQAVPVVTGTMDHDVIDKMIGLAEVGSRHRSAGARQELRHSRTADCFGEMRDAVHATTRIRLACGPVNFQTRHPGVVAADGAAGARTGAVRLRRHARGTCHAELILVRPDLLAQPPSSSAASASASAWLAPASTSGR